MVGTNAPSVQISGADRRSLAGAPPRSFDRATYKVESVVSITFTGAEQPAAAVPSTSASGSIDALGSILVGPVRRGYELPADLVGSAEMVDDFFGELVWSVGRVDVFTAGLVCSVGATHTRASRR